MKNYACKIAFILGLIVFIISQSQIYGQEKPNYINLNYILVKLTFTSRISHSTQEINEQLIKDIRERQVDFILSSENEKWVKDSGGSDLLITEIRANLPKNIEEKLHFWNEADALYQKYRDNYQGDFKQKNIALEAAREFIKRYGDEKNIKEEFREEFTADYKAIITYLKSMIPKLEPNWNIHLSLS